MNWVIKKHNILTHIILTYITCGIWLIIYFGCKSSSKKQDLKKQILYERTIEYNNTEDDKLNDYIRIEKQYKSVLDQHYKNIEKINMLYTIANNLSLPNSPEMQKVIDLCIEDIRLAPTIRKYCEEIANNYGDNLENHLINYVSFQRLAIIYEKQKQYHEAIDVCKQAIQLGFYKDGTAGQMPGRLARLIKKANSNIKIN